MIKHLLSAKQGNIVAAFIFSFSFLLVSVADAQVTVPDAVEDILTTDEDAAGIIDICLNDIPSDDGGNVWSLIGTNGGAQNGTVTALSGCSYQYTPDANFNGPDTFYYKITDVDGDDDTARVIVFVTSVDDQPTASNDNVTTDEDQQVAGDLSTNDTHSGDGGDVYSLYGVNAGALHGTVSIAGDGTFDYTPDANYNGTDEFYYEVCDIDGDCSQGTVSVTINPTNDVPDPVHDYVVTDEETYIDIDVCANDNPSPDGGNVWDLSGVNGGALHGTVTAIDQCNYTYTPDLDFNGLDSFAYTICDGENDCATGIVTITVNQVDDYPEAYDDVDVTDENTPVTINVCLNDVPSGDGGNTWDLIGVNGGALHGTVTKTSDCEFEYTPDPNYEGTDLFIYQVCDADGDCSIASVSLTMNPINDVPVAADDDFVAYEETALIDDVSPNDYLSTDGGNYYSVSIDPSHGIVLMNLDGTFVYIPEDRYVGLDTFYYNICDVESDCDEGMVTITVDPPQQSECRWCNKSTATSIVNSLYGDACIIPDILVDVRLSHLPVDTYKILKGHPATGSLQAAINYVNTYGDPSPGDGKIFIGVVASDCQDIDQCGDPQSRSAASSTPYGIENVVVTNLNSEQLNIIGCNAYLRPAVSALPVIKVENSVGPVRISYLNVQNSLAEGILVRNNSSSTIITHCKALYNNIGLRIQDDNVTVSTMQEVGYNNIGILMEGTGGNIVTLSSAVENNFDAGIKVVSNFNTISKNTVGGTNRGNNTGILVLGTNNTISENIVSYNDNDGIKVASSFNNLFKNTSVHNGGHGINADQGIGASFNTLSYNKGDYNTLQGIRACGQVDNGNNTAANNSGYPQLVFNCNPASVYISTPSTYVCGGTSATFTAVASDIGPSPNFQWKRNGATVGTNSATYSATNISNGDQIYCIVSPSVTCCIAGAPAMSNVITMSVFPPVQASISISANPGNTVCTGTSVTFTATALNGGSNPVYQWKRNGSNVGTNSSSYTSSTFTDGNTVSCILTSNATCVIGSPASSNTIAMNVLAKVSPSVTIAANQSTTICSGTMVTFYATPSYGGTAPSFQWKKNGIVVGTNSSSLSLNTLVNGDKISCVLTSNYPCLNTLTATSNVITMTVASSLTPSVSIVSSVSGTISSSTSVTFTATPVNGGGSPVYQWLKNGAFVGNNSATYTNSSWANGDQVQVRLTSSISCPSINPVFSNVIGISTATFASEKYMTVDISADKAFRYDANFNLVSSQSLTNANADANDVCYAGTVYYVLDKSDKTVYRYAGSVIVSRILKDPAGSSLNNPVGVSVSGDDLWVTDAGKKFIYKYSLTSAFATPTGNVNALLQIPFNSLNGTGSTGMFADPSFLYVLDNTRKQFFRYQKTSPYTSVASRVIRDNGGNALQTANGAALDGSNVLVVDAGRDFVFQYDLGSLFFGTGTILSGTQYPLNIANFNVTGIAVIGSTAKPADVPVVTSDSKPGEVVKAFPNPYEGSVNFRITPPAMGKASLELFDVTGRKIMTVFEGNLEKGKTVDILQDISPASRQPMYFKFMQGDATAQGLLIPSGRK